MKNNNNDNKNYNNNGRGQDCLQCDTNKTQRLKKQAPGIHNKKQEQQQNVDVITYGNNTT